MTSIKFVSLPSESTMKIDISCAMCTVLYEAETWAVIEVASKELNALGLVDVTKKSKGEHYLNPFRFMRNS